MLHHRLAGTALALALLICGSLSAGGGEDSAVTFVEELGGKVTRDAKAAGKPGVSVVLSKSKIPAAGLAKLKPLGALRSLNLGRTKVTDAGLKHLIDFEHLATLMLTS